MEESQKFQQMQDEMSRFEAEISGTERAAAAQNSLRPVISSNTFGNVQQQLERMPPLPPPPQMPFMPPFDGSLMPRQMFPGIPPPPPPPSLMIPQQVRMRPNVSSDGSYGGPMQGIPQFIRPNILPGPAAMPPPPKPQPAVLTGAPKLYRKEKQHEEKKQKLELSVSSLPLKQVTSESEVKSQSKLPPIVNSVTTVVANEQNKPVKKEKKAKKVVRTAGGTVWEDVTMLDWADDDFRLFAGDLGNDVTDELLTRTFSKYPSFQKAKVVRDKRTNKSRGFGFISFKEPSDFIKAMKEMNGRYVGSRPIKLHKSTWKNRSLDIVRKKEKEKAALLALLSSGKS